MMPLTQGERASLFELMKKKFTEEDFFKWVMEKYWNDGAFKENFKGSFEEWYTEYKNGCELKLDEWGADEDLLFLLGQKDEERNALAKYYFANFGGNLDYLLNPFRKIPNCEGCEGVTLEKCIEYLFLKDIHNNKEGQADLRNL